MFDEEQYDSELNVELQKLKLEKEKAKLIFYREGIECQKTCKFAKTFFIKIIFFKSSYQVEVSLQSQKKTKLDCVYSTMRMCLVFAS